MNIAPNTILALYIIPHYGDNENYCFASEDDKKNFLEPKAEFVNVQCTYQRKTGRFKFDLGKNKMSEDQWGRLQKCNLCSWLNSSYENDPYYARIVQWHYINNRVIEISFEIDWWLSFQNRCSYEGGFIRREYLSQAEYALSLQNPYDPSLIKLRTAEDVPTGETVLARPTGREDTKVYPKLRAADWNGCALIKVADFRWGDVDPTLLYNVVTSASETVSPSGAVYTNNINTPSGQLTFVVPRGYYLFVLYMPKLNEISKFLDNLTLALGDAGAIISMTYTYKQIWDSYKIIAQRDPNYPLIEMTAPSVSKYRNKKLALAPFTFLQVVNSVGEKKDILYELFGEATATFVTIHVLDDVGYSTLVPVGYAGDPWASAEHRIDSPVYTEMGYSTDAYISMLATQMQTILRSNHGIINNIYEGITSHAGDIAGIANSLAPQNLGSTIAQNALSGPLARSIAGSGSAAPSGPVTAEQVQTAIPAVAAGIAMASGGSIESAASLYDTLSLKNAAIEKDYAAMDSYFGPAKEGYVVDHYTPGTAPSLGYYLPMGNAGDGFDYGTGIFILINRQMDPALMDMYNNMFDLIGMAYNQYDVPLVCNYVKGETSPSKLPDFCGDNYTYIQCDGLHVTGMSKECTSAISRMFQAGVRLYNSNAR